MRIRKTKYYIVDGAESYQKESDIFDLKNSSIKLIVKNPKDDIIKVITDDDMFSPTGIYTININTGEILSEKRYCFNPKDILLKNKYDNLMINLNRGIVPHWAIDKRYKENQKPLDIKEL